MARTKGALGWSQPIKWLRPPKCRPVSLARLVCLLEGDGSSFLPAVGALWFHGGRTVARLYCLPPSASLPSKKHGPLLVSPSNWLQYIYEWPTELVTQWMCEHPHLTCRPEIRRDYPLNLSISLSGGKETNKDSPSNGERSGKSPAPNPLPLR